MTFEYYGWLVLQTSQTDWSDEEFRKAFDEVAKVAQSLPRETGHEAIVPDCVVLPRVLYLKGFEVESLDPVFQLIEQVIVQFDIAFGELAACELTSNQWVGDKAWNSQSAARYVFNDGRVTRIKGQVSIQD